ncbi:MAG: translation initiation factor 2 [Rhizobiaceae bacterium]
MKLAQLSTITLLCLSTASCATVARGTTEDVTIKTTPADANVVTSLNHVCQTNPCVVKVPRKESFQVTASKPGYETKTINVGTKVSGKGATGLAGNLLLGGVIGVGVDVATGAARDHTPNPVIIDLLPVGSENKLRPVTKPKGSELAPASTTVPTS